MASYFFRMDPSKECKADAPSHHAYIMRETPYKNGRNPLIYGETNNLPSFFESPKQFWQDAELFERKNGLRYREIKMALPNELSQEEWIAMTKEFCENHFGKDFVYSVAIHNDEAKLANKINEIYHPENKEKIMNPHVHIMFCERKLDNNIRHRPSEFFKRANTKNPAKGGCPKDEKWNGKDRKEYVKEMRKDWAEIQNKTFEKNRLSVRVDHRKIEDRLKEAISENNEEKEIKNSYDEYKEKRIFKAGLYIEKFDNEEIPERVKMQIELTNLQREFKIKIHRYAEEIAYQKTYENNKKELAENLKKIKENIEILNKEIYAEMQKILQKYKEAEKEVISETRAKIMAKSIATNGEDKELRNKKNTTENEIKKHQKEYEKFLETPPPNRLNLFKYKEWEKEKNEIEKKGNELDIELNKIIKKQEGLEDKLSQPYYQTKVEIIMNKILEKNIIKKNIADNLQKEYSELKNIQKEVLQLKKTTLLKKEKIQPISIPKINTNSNIGKLIDDLNKNIPKLQLENNDEELSKQEKIMKFHL